MFSPPLHSPLAVLEGIIQSLQEELGEKKKLIKQLTGGSAGVDVKSDVTKTVAAAGSDVRLLRSLLESSLAEGARIKHDMRVVGEELSVAQEKLGRVAAEKGALLARIAEAEAAAAAARREAEERLQQQQQQYGEVEDGRGSGLPFGDDGAGSGGGGTPLRGVGGIGGSLSRPGSEAEHDADAAPPPPTGAAPADDEEDEEESADAHGRSALRGNPF